VTIATEDGRRSIESVEQPVLRYQTGNGLTAAVSVETITIFASGYPDSREPAQESLVGVFQDAHTESFVTLLLVPSGTITEVPGRQDARSLPDADPVASYSVREFRSRYEQGTLAPCDDETLFFAEFL
jgi:hypothetical protein